MFSSRAQSGKRARYPRWWGVMTELMPKVYLSWMEPRIWTKELAEKWVKAIPSKCPFERQLWWGERLVLYIPPLCPLNPLSSQLYAIRLKAQTYLASLSKDLESV